MKSAIDQYIERWSSPPSTVLQELYRETWLRTLYPRMASGQLQGKLLAFICQMMQAKSVLEIGTFTGYATIAMAEVMPSDGTIITIEADEELEPMIRKYIQKAGVEAKVQLMIGDATTIIPVLTEQFDLIFLDANKSAYPAYYEPLKAILRSGGFLIADNVLWGGKVADEHANDQDTKAIRAFNELAANDEEMEQLILPLRDGLNIIRKR